MRKLKFHEKKLLKKVDFLQWKSDRTARELKVVRQYMISDRQDYVKCVLQFHLHVPHLLHCHSTPAGTTAWQDR